MNYEIKNIDDGRVILYPETNENGFLILMTTNDFDIKNGITIENFCYKISEEFIIKPKSIVTTKQVHGDNIFEVDGKINRFYQTNECDGLIGGEGTMLAIKTADCIPVVFYSKERKVHANIHSGWKGTLKNISIKALNILCKEYLVDTKECIVHIGQGIGFENFEVEEDVAKQFYDKFGMNKNFILKKNEIKYNINLQEIIKEQLIANGILKENIFMYDESTYSNPNIYHSYRRDGKDYGLMTTISYLE